MYYRHHWHSFVIQYQIEFYLGRKFLAVRSHKSNETLHLLYKADETTAADNTNMTAILIL